MVKTDAKNISLLNRITSGILSILLKDLSRQDFLRPEFSWFIAPIANSTANFRVSAARRSKEGGPSVSGASVTTRDKSKKEVQRRAESSRDNREVLNEAVPASKSA